MISAREEILATIRQNVRRSGHGGRHTLKSIPREYVQFGDYPTGSPELVELLVETLEGYGANVTYASTEEELQHEISEALGDLVSVVVPSDMDPNWIKAAMSRHMVYLDSPEEPLTHATLDNVDAVLTGSRCAVAQTGSVILDGGHNQGRRAISLIPDTHVVIVDTCTIVQTVPEAFSILDEHPTRPITWIAGPSATSDIELSRVEGVHGPRNLLVILSNIGDQQ